MSEEGKSEKPEQPAQLDRPAVFIMGLSAIFAPLNVAAFMHIPPHLVLYAFPRPLRGKVLESVIHRPPPISYRRKLDNFLFKIGLSFASRDE